MRKLLVFLFSVGLFGQDLVIERPARTWEFLDSTGPRAAWLGREDGTLEAYVWPLKILKDLHLSFRLGARVIPASSIARSIEARPGSYSIRYRSDEFSVTQTLDASGTEAGVIMRLSIESSEPVETIVEFTRDFQLMWPAAIGSGYVAWDDREKFWFFGADGHPFAAVFGSPSARRLDAEYATNYSQSTVSAFSLGEVNGHGDVVLALAGSVKSRDEARAAYKRLVANPQGTIDAASRFYSDYLERTVRIDVPDKMIQRAYDWARIATFKGMVENPLLGRGLVAGYGPSKGLYRPGFAWFFGRDSFWTSFALTAAGDLASSRDAIDFVAQFQRDDGKIPHEISQSASLIPWWKDYPYGFASADATPLYVIAVRDYVEASGDAAFARKHWPRLQKALQFMHATLEPAGFPKNYEVGHGWIEGGPLLPVRVEFYQAGCYVEALRSLAKLARLTGDASAAALEQEYQTKQKALNDVFWLAGAGAYAFALGLDGTPVSQPSVLATVPMWFGVTDLEKSQTMIQQLAREEHAPDWGMRIISARSPQFGPAGYHFGSVWPLFTGWASVGEYREHVPEPALANLRANAWLTLDGAGGVTTEVLSGASYSPLSTSSPHQIWSSAMVISPVLRGLFGLKVDATEKRLVLQPHLPADWHNAAVRGVRLGQGTVDFELLWPASGEMQLRIDNKTGAPFELEFAPAVSPADRVMKAAYESAPLKWTEARNSNDWHPVFLVQVKPGSSVLTAQAPRMGYIVPWNPPQLGATSSNLKVLSERWTSGSLELTVSGLAGREYAIRTSAGASVAVIMPAGASGTYVMQTVRLRLPI
jgi:glycogen debranching enzyme